MKIRKFQWLVVLVMGLTMTSCTGGGRHAPQLTDIEKTLEQHQDRDDIEGLTALIDSLEAESALTDVQLGYWRGAVCLMKRDRAEAMRWFRKALDGDIQKPVNHQAYYSAADILSNMLNSKGDHQGTLEVAMPAVTAMEERGHTDHVYFSSMLYTIGNSQLRLNMFDDGERTLNRAMDIFDRQVERDTTGTLASNRVVTLINIAIPYIDKQRYEEADRWLKRAAKALDFYAAMPTAISRKVDRSRGRLLTLSAEVQQGLGHTQEAAKTYDEARRTDFGQTTDGQIDATGYLQAAGRWAEAADIYEPLDSILHDWNLKPTLGTLAGLMLAKYRSNVGAGRRAAAAAVSEQICNALDSAVRWERESKATELATIYQLKEEQLARQQAEADARIMRLVTIAVAVALLLVMLFAAYFFYQRRQMAEKNKALVRFIDQITASQANHGDRLPDTAQDQRPATAEKPQTSPDLFRRFTALIHDEQLYRDIALDRDTVCQRLGIERHSLNQLLNDHAGGLSLPAYLNTVRLDAAYDLLHNQPDESIADIAAAVGFTPQNLRLQFKKRYGLTPTEYRQNQ